MEKAENHRVMVSYLPALRLFGVYNMENLHGDQSALRYMCLKLVSAVIVAMYAWCGVLLFWNCFDGGFTLSSPTIPAAIGSIQITLTYFSFIWNNREISATIEHLERLTQERKSDAWVEAFLIRANGLNPSIILLGSAKCAESFTIYKRIEEKHSKITQTAGKILAIVLIGQFISTGLVPVVYAIFGVPTPEQWHLPVAMQ